MFTYERLLTSWLLISVLRHEERERDTILKSLSYHTMLTKLKRFAHLLEFWISFHLHWSGTEKLNRMLQRSKPKLLNTMVGTQLLLSVYMAQVDYQLDRSPFDNQLDWSPGNYQLDSPTIEYPTQLAHSKNPTDVFFKIPKFSAHRFRAWRHSHSSFISYLGFVMTIVIVISSANERKLYPMSVHLN